MACCHVFEHHPSGKICMFEDCKALFFGPLTEQDRARLATFRNAVLPLEKGLKGSRELEEKIHRRLL